MDHYPDYILIPYQVISDTRIEPIAEKLYGLIYWYVGMGMHKCFVSNTVLSKLLNTSPRTIQNALDSLETSGYIKRVYKDKSRRHRSEIIPMLTFKSQIATVVTPEKQTETVVTLDSNGGDHIQNTKNNKKYIAGASPAPWILEEKLQEMEQKENSHLDIIATFIREKPVQIENSKQLTAVIKRYARVAQQLSGAYTNKQIFGAAEKVRLDNKRRESRGDTVDWTLETLLKILTK